MVKNKYSLLHAKITDCGLETELSELTFFAITFVYLIAPRGLLQHLSTPIIQVQRRGTERGNAYVRKPDVFRPPQRSCTSLFQPS